MAAGPTTLPISPWLKDRLEITAGIRRGLADMAAGRVVPQDVAVTELQAVIAAAGPKQA